MTPPDKLVLNPDQENRVLSYLRHADKLLSEIEDALNAASSKSPFPRFRPDIDPAEGKLVEDYLARIRARMLLALDGMGIEPPAPTLGGRRSIRVTLAFVKLALQEIAPDHLVGCGVVPKTLVPELEGLSAELRRLVAELDAVLEHGPGDGLEEKLAALGDNGDEYRAVRDLGGIIIAQGLVELRKPLSFLVNRLETRRFEIAVFGRVSSGRSALLNNIAGAELLPVGVNPITAVPTRLVWSEEAGVTVTLAGRKPAKYDLARLPEFATEWGNPGNKKAVTEIVVEYPAERLPEGLALVDTPGLGSLTTAASSESLAYLPQCDLGILLINAAGTLTKVDLSAIRALRSADIPALVILSKADLLSSGDQEAAREYIRGEILTQIGELIAVDPVSVVGPGRQLLENWLERRILPLFENPRQLRAASLHRRLVAIQESVVAALRMKIKRAETSFAQAAHREDYERALRSAEDSIASLHLPRPA